MELSVRLTLSDPLHIILHSKVAILIRTGMKFHLYYNTFICLEITSQSYRIQFNNFSWFEYPIPPFTVKGQLKYAKAQSFNFLIKM